MLVSAPFHQVPSTLVVAGAAYLLSGHSGAICGAHKPDAGGRRIVRIGNGGGSDQNGDGFEDYASAKPAKGWSIW